LIDDLKLIVVGSTDNQLRLFRLSQHVQTGQLELALVGNLKKDSGSRVLEMNYDRSLRLLEVLSSDNKFELFKVNIDKKDSLIKKLLRVEKRKALKRKRQQAEDESEGEEVKNLKLDKDQILQKFEEEKYDMSIHFSKRLAFELDSKSKVKSF
jgi:hypothetical protein